MIAVIAIHVLILLLALAIGARIVPQSLVAGTVGYLHNAIGITTPRVDQVRTVAFIWIGAVLMIADGVLLLLFFLVTHAHA